MTLGNIFPMEVRMFGYIVARPKQRTKAEIIVGCHKKKKKMKWYPHDRKKMSEVMLI